MYIFGDGSDVPNIVSKLSFSLEVVKITSSPYYERGKRGLH
jgi:hypothetical protein